MDIISNHLVKINIYCDITFSHSLVIEKPERKQLHGVGYEGLTNSTDTTDTTFGDTVETVHESEAVGLCKALRIPGVLEYSFCLFFAKLVSYTFLFWLPYYIIATPIGGSHLNAMQSADLATLFDVGGAFGGIVAGESYRLAEFPTLCEFWAFLAPLALGELYSSVNLTPAPLTPALTLVSNCAEYKKVYMQ